MTASASSMASASTDKLSNCQSQKGDNSNNYGSISIPWWGSPSQSSTDAATKDRMHGNGDYSYQAVRMSGSGFELDKMEESLKNKSNKHRKLQVVLFVVVVALIAVPSYYALSKTKSNSEEYNVARTSSIPFPFEPKNGRRPLSTLHPVHDLGLSFFARPEATRPSQALFQKTTTSTRRMLAQSSKHGHSGKETDDDDSDTSQNSPQSPFPTNAWYQNMLLVPHGKNGDGQEPTNVHRAYATPFIVDAVGPIPGLRVHPNHVDASSSVVQVNTVDNYGLTVGAAVAAAGLDSKSVKKTNKHHSKKEKYETTPQTNATTTPTANISHVYSVENMTPLGLTLGWEKSFPMTSSIVKGMPYATMKYDAMQSNDDDGKTWYPTVASEISLAKEPIVDGKIQVSCHGFVHKVPTVVSTSSSNSSLSNSSSSNSSSSNSSITFEDQPKQYRVQVEREIELHFSESDFTWLVFVSKPVTVECVVHPDTGGMQLQVVDDHDDNEDEAAVDASISVEGDREVKEQEDNDESPFFIRIALANFCTSNANPIYCHHEQMIPYSLNVGQGRYDDLLRNHSHLMPGPDTSFDYVIDQAKQEIHIEFDWDVKDMRHYDKDVSSRKKDITLDNDLIVFALPHHLDLMGTRFAPGYLKYCASTLIGPACLLAGSKWSMVEHLPQIDFRAPRSPAPWVLPALAESVGQDLKYRMPKFYKKGAGDTYFSGKMLAKLARVLTIAEELKELCGPGNKESHKYEEVCSDIRLPNDRTVNKALDELRNSVEVWINGKAVTPFVYDDAWGGVVSCGCNNPDGGECRNKFPECPAFTDPGLNFGNAFYNDLHFHYGYHIYAAAVVSHFDADWGKEFFEPVLLLVRNIANPSYDGDYFPAFRHKDWYQGHSWASGVVPPYLNGRNQESSSESIAAYEAVALYGTVMTSVWEQADVEANIQAAKDVHEAGQILVATELRSTRRYYHVRDKGNANQALKIYPSEYNNHAIGMMWNTMAQYQTWFGGKPYLAAGIQLLPITPIAEQRDGVQWLTEMYPSFNKTCSENKDCEENGWSVLQLASLATIGHQEEAAKGAQALAPSVFASAGGNGHSLSNTLWYIATRPVVDEPAQFGNATKEEDDNTTDNLHVLTNCLRPETCTDYVLDTIANEYSCRQRITDLMYTDGHTQEEACFMVAKIQFPQHCGACNPNGTDTSSANVTAQCPPCTVSQCQSSLNRCPQFRQTFVCTDGPNLGGCSRFPWDVRSTQCTGCCELTECAQRLSHH